MPFEAFLSETHSRPPRASAFGFLASLAMHGPPITLFVTTWLTHASLIGSSGVYPETQPRRGTFYIPISIYGEGPGGGGDPTSRAVASGGTRPRAGVLGRSGRAGRRGLVAPREVKRLPSKTTWNDPFMLGSYAVPSARGAVGHDSGEGDDHAGGGMGSGNVGFGTGGGPMMGGVGNGMIAATLVERSKTSASDKKTSHGAAHNKGKERAAADGEDDLEIGTDLSFLLEDGRQVKAAYISQDSAAYYRIEDPMPTLHAYWTPGRREWAMLFRICVSPDGTVSSVSVLKSGSDEVDQVFTATMKTWRYRPRVIDGAARPFCHPIRIIYARQL
jgi:hypothetical protein